MKKFFLSLTAMTAALFSIAQSGKNMVVIKGTITGDLKGHNKIYLFTRAGSDSAEVVNGQYILSFPFKDVEFKTLFPEYLRYGNRSYQPFGVLFTEPGTYYVSFDAEKGMYQSAEVKGPEGATLYRNYEKDNNEAYKKMNFALSKMYGDQWYRIDEKNPAYTAFQKSKDSLYDVFVNPVMINLLKKHPNSPASAFVLSNSGRQLSSIEKKEELLKMLSPEMRKTSFATKFADHIEGLKNSAVGKKVKNFVLPDPSDKDLALDKFKGKYVLIDFWASWCGPCRQSFPRMRQVYSTYKDQAFEIYSISIDENKAAWLKAVKDENNPWAQSLDNQNISQSRFAVTAVPTTFLLGPDGTIILSELGFDPKGGSEIEKKLASIFGKEVPPVKEEKKPETKSGGMMKAIPMSK